MDLGIKGRKALVTGASKGLGKACAMALAREGAEVTITGRTAKTLAEAVEDIRRATGAPVNMVVGDITTDEGREAALAACPAPDILVTNAGGPPAGDFREWGRAEWGKALDANLLAPVFLIKAVIDPMIARRFGRIVNITSHAVKAPIATLGLSNAARIGLTGFIAGLSRQVVRHNVSINNLLPGLHDTDRQFSAMAGIAKAQGISVEEAIKRYVAALPAARIGKPSEFGDACAYLCSAQAGCFAGLNMSADGGAYPGTMG